ncbi:Uncharacterized protein Fot_32569 [Forsythia ovata]|uniref:Uncharacterized protein n=1 Tax=Forsythia ovata TaxID=205694 RepID=A0ABD1T878_9LAMI
MSLCGSGALFSEVGMMEYIYDIGDRFDAKVSTRSNIFNVEKVYNALDDPFTLFTVEVDFRKSTMFVYDPDKSYIVDGQLKDSFKFNPTTFFTREYSRIKISKSQLS